jgi:ribosome-associated protein
MRGCVAGRFGSLLMDSTRNELADSMAGRTAVAAQQNDHSLQLALIAARVAQENRGRDIVILDMRELTSVFDYFVIASGSSVRQLHAISDEIESEVKKTLSDRKIGREGYAEGGWVLIDYGDVVVHLFDGKSRDYYGLEDLWSDARRVPFAPELSVRSDDSTS